MEKKPKKLKTTLLRKSQYWVMVCDPPQPCPHLTPGVGGWDLPGAHSQLRSPEGPRAPTREGLSGLPHPRAIPPQDPSLSSSQPTKLNICNIRPSVCLGRAQLWGVPAGAVGDTAGRCHVRDFKFYFSFLVLMFVVAFGFLLFRSFVSSVSSARKLHQS